MLAIPTFGHEDASEEAGAAYPSLATLMPYADALASVLGDYGFAIDRPDGSGLTSGVLRERFSTVTDEAPTLPRVVHVLSHGKLGQRSANLKVIGCNGKAVDPSLGDWVGAVEDRAEETQTSQPTLFVLDICHAGAAAELPWQVRGADEKTMAWVLAASDKDEEAFDGRLTQALTSALRAGLDGTLGADPSLEFLPWELVRNRVISEVEKASATGLAQRVRSTLLDHPINPRIFANPRYDPVRARTVLAGLDPALTELVASVDASVDPLHFIGRAASRRARGPARAAYFSGRTRELEDLTDFLDAERAGGVRLVTGSPGCGKSALLGIVVCAAHPRLREATRDVWNAAATAPSRLDDIAAVHARQRSTTEIASALARQLVIDGSATPTPADVLALLTDRRTAVTVVIDAVDEAADPGGVVRDLLLPLAELAQSGEGIRVVVGTRTGAQWPMIDPLRRVLRAGELLDLDDVPAPVLAADLRRFVSNVLADDPRFTPVRRRLAGDIAETLSTGSDGTIARGAFLVAGLYLNHLQQSATPRGPGRHADQAEIIDVETLVASIPRTLPEVLELSLRSETSGVDRAVLAALAWAKGEGMPLPLVTAVARGLRWAESDGDAVTDDAVLKVLTENRVGHFLRRTVDVDGSTLYRLFHQGLADYLRVQPRASDDSPTGIALLVWRALLDHRRDARGKPVWTGAEPYLARHALDHAVDAGQGVDLLADAGFLIISDLPHALGTLARSDEGVRSCDGAEVVRLAAVTAPPAPGFGRTGLLCLTARRLGCVDLADSAAAFLPAGRLAPDWATGENSRGPRHTLTGHTGGVTAVATTTIGETPVAVTGSSDGQVLVWDLDTGERRHTLTGHTDWVRAVATTTIGETPVAVTRSNDGQVLVWDLDTGERRHALTGHTDWVRAVATTTIGETPVAVTGSNDGQVLAWDLAAGEVRQRILLPQSCADVAWSSTGGLVVAFGRDVAYFEQVR